MLSGVQTETEGSKQIFFSFGVNLESTGEWKGQKENIKMKGMQILEATNTC